MKKILIILSIITTMVAFAYADATPTPAITPNISSSACGTYKNVGDTITYVEYVNLTGNDGSDTVNGLYTWDTLPTGLSYAGYYSSCCAVTKHASGSEVYFEWGSGYVTGNNLKLDLYVTANGAAFGTIGNVFSAGASNAANANSGNCNMIINTPTPNIQISKTGSISCAGSGHVVDGGTYAYYLQGSVAGTGNNVVIWDTLDNNVNYVSAIPDPTMVIGQELYWEYSTITNATQNITVSIAINGGTTLHNAPNIGADGCTNKTGFGCVWAVDSPTPTPYIVPFISATYSQGTHLNVGDMLTYELYPKCYGNTGDIMTNPFIWDTLPTNTTYVGYTWSGAIYVTETALGGDLYEFQEPDVSMLGGSTAAGSTIYFIVQINAEAAGTTISNKYSSVADNLIIDGLGNTESGSLNTIINSLTLISTKTITPTITTTKTPTATVTPTITQRVKLLPTKTVTKTITPTWSVSPTKTITKTRTPTKTITSTITKTGTITPTITKTATKTITETRTGSPTKTVTKTITETKTVSSTKTITQTITETFTKTVTKTITETRTAFPTKTVTQTITKTITKTPICSRTRTPTKTPMCSPTITLTATITATKTITLTPTITQTFVPFTITLVNQFDDKASIAIPIATGLTSNFAIYEDGNFMFNTTISNSKMDSQTVTTTVYFENMPNSYSIVAKQRKSPSVFYQSNSLVIYAPTLTPTP